MMILKKSYFLKNNENIVPHQSFRKKRCKKMILRSSLILTIRSKIMHFSKTEKKGEELIKTAIFKINNKLLISLI